MSKNRFNDVTYKNTTGYPIFVSIGETNDAWVNGMPVGGSNVKSWTWFSFIVGAGDSYKVSLKYRVAYWVEYRV